MEILTHKIQKKVVKLSNNLNSKNIIFKREFKNKNIDNPNFKVRYLISLFYKIISILQLVDSILNKLVTASTL